MYTAELANSGTMKCPLFRIPGYHIGSVMQDYLHDDLIGLRQHGIGSIVALMCRGEWFWSSPQGRGDWKSKVNWQLKLACRDFDAWKRERKASCSFRGLTVNKLHLKTINGDFPWLKCKAYVASVLTRWLYNKMEELQASNGLTSIQTQVKSLLWGFNTTYKVIASPTTLLTSEGVRVVELGRQATLFCYTHLAAEFATDNTKLFKLTCKIHRLDHCLRRACKMQLNPGLWWTMFDESRRLYFSSGYK